MTNLSPEDGQGLKHIPQIRAVLRPGKSVFGLLCQIRDERPWRSGLSRSVLCREFALYKQILRNDTPGSCLLRVLLEWSHCEPAPASKMARLSFHIARKFGDAAVFPRPQWTLEGTAGPRDILPWSHFNNVSREEVIPRCGQPAKDLVS